MTDSLLTVEALSEDSLLLRFGERIDLETNTRVHAAARTLSEAALPGISDIAPAYTTLLLRFDPWTWSQQDQCGRSPHESLSKTVRTCLHGFATAEHASRARRDQGQPHAAPQRTTGSEVEIPVCYGGDYGPDLALVANHARLSAEEVIARHTAGGYTVAMLGFMPGFAYLLGLDPRLHLPRRADPRTRVPAGSIGIGGAQTGIYPRELPGGWQLIGRTPQVLFDADRAPPALLAPGDRVRFRQIGRNEFERLANAKA